jgi:hypothetical protein
MSLSLTCRCGACFEVEETYSGQSVTCPDCHLPVQAPRQQSRPLRTSGFALASVLVALLLGMTPVVPLAVLLGIVALAHIRRHRDEVTGTLFAVAGIVLGGVFSLLFGLAVIQTEMFGVQFLREGMMGAQVDRSGPMEVIRAVDGFAIRRPSARWGVAQPGLARTLVPGSALVLVNVARDGYIDVTPDFLNARTLQQYGQDVVNHFYDNRDEFGRPRPGGLRARNVQLKRMQPLPPSADRECLDMLVELQLGPQRMTYLIRVIRPIGSDRIFLVRGWGQTRRFPQFEQEVRDAMDSVRFVNM